MYGSCGCTDFELPGWRRYFIMDVIGYIRVIVLSGLFLPFAALASDCDDVIRDEVDGRFYGWYGDTKVELENGQVWQQVDGHRERDHYLSRGNPEVVGISRSGRLRDAGDRVLMRPCVWSY